MYGTVPYEVCCTAGLQRALFSFSIELLLTMVITALPSSDLILSYYSPQSAPIVVQKSIAPVHNSAVRRPAIRQSD